MEEVKRINHKNHIILGILSVITIFTIVTILIYRFVFPVLLLGGFFDSYPSKEEIKKAFLQNREKYELSIENIKKLIDTLGVLSIQNIIKQQKILILMDYLLVDLLRVAI